jgi:hypothetical protein
MPPEHLYRPWHVQSPVLFVAAVPTAPGRGYQCPSRLAWTAVSFDSDDVADVVSLQGHSGPNVALPQFHSHSALIQFLRGAEEEELAVGFVERNAARRSVEGIASLTHLRPAAVSAVTNGALKTSARTIAPPRSSRLLWSATPQQCLPPAVTTG